MKKINIAYHSASIPFVSVSIITSMSAGKTMGFLTLKQLNLKGLFYSLIKLKIGVLPNKAYNHTYGT